MSEPSIWFECADCSTTFGLDLEFLDANTKGELQCPICKSRAYSHVLIEGFGDD